MLTLCEKLMSEAFELQGLAEDAISAAGGVTDEAWMNLRAASELRRAARAVLVI